jgi:preprotein translocase subunit YajC
MKKLLLSSVLVFTIVFAPLSASAQVVSLPGSNNNNLIAQLELIIELLQQVQELQEQLAEIQNGDEVATIGESAGEPTTTQEEEVSVSTKERAYISAAASCATNRIDNAQQVWKTKDDFAKYSTGVLNLPRISLQKKFEMISDKNTKQVDPDLKELEGELKVIELDCKNTIQPVEGVTAASSTPVTQAIAAIPPQITKLETDLAANNALSTCSAPPLTPDSAGISQIKKTVLAEQCKAKSSFFKAQIDALTKQKKALETI